MDPDAIPAALQSFCALADDIDALVGRLNQANGGPFSCRELSLARTHCAEARHWISELIGRLYSDGAGVPPSPAP